jgi:cell division protein FtsQ
MSAFLRLMAWLLALALVLLPVVAVIRGWVGAERWPLRTVLVNGQLTRVTDAQIVSAVYPHAQRGFFAVRLEDAQGAVARLPWIEHAEVRKQWPDKLVVTVVEHRPFAWWGRDRLLSERGVIIAAKGVAAPKGLPRFDGPEARSGDLVRLYNEARAMFAAGGLDVRTLAIDDRGSWSMTLSNGAEVLLGRDDARLRLQRFARLLPQFPAQNDRTLKRADLRYTNGFALSWASGGEQVDANRASAAEGHAEAEVAAPGMAANTRTTNSELRPPHSGFTT